MARMIGPKGVLRSKETLVYTFLKIPTGGAIILERVQRSFTSFCE